MKKINKILISLLCMALILCSGTFLGLLEGTQHASADTFNDYNQAHIVSHMGAGWNLGNQLEACSNGNPSETAWGNPKVSESLIKAVKDAGFRTIRVPVSYLKKITYNETEGKYEIDEAWLNRIKEVVDYCINNDLFTIINMHGDGYKSVQGSWLLCDADDQTEINKKYKDCWSQIASTFADYDEHLIFESMNEEFDGSYSNPNKTYYENINVYNQNFVDTVRQSGGNNDKRWLLIPGWNTDINYTAGNYGFKLPTDNYKNADVSGNRIMISVHYYDPWSFAGSGEDTQWGEVATDKSKVSSWGQEDYMTEQIEKNEQEVCFSRIPCSYRGIRSY
jgi:endoglucanase